MNQGNDRPVVRRFLPLIALAVAAVIIAVVFLFALRPGGDGAPTSAGPSATASGVGDTPTPTPDPSSTGDDVSQPVPSPFGAVLPEAMSGQDAIDALGEKIDVVASRNNKTVDELTDLLLRDSTVHISTTGRIFYRDDFGSNG